MTFRWWWIPLAVVAIWFFGWLVSTVVLLFFDPESSGKDKRETWKGRLASCFFLNWFLWPWLLPAVLERRRLYRDMRSGRRPNWITLDKEKGEQSGKEWILSDGTKFGASVSSASYSSEPSKISANYDDDTQGGPVEYRVRRIAPMPEKPTIWTRMTFTSRELQPIQNDEDAVDDYMSSRYEVSIKLSRGKYEIEFCVPNRSGKFEECGLLTLIVTDPEDYDS